MATCDKIFEAIDKWNELHKDAMDIARKTSVQEDRDLYLSVATKYLEFIEKALEIARQLV